MLIIPDDVMIGAGTLIPPGKVLESGYLYVGSPAKKSLAFLQKRVGIFTVFSTKLCQSIGALFRVIIIGVFPPHLTDTIMFLESAAKLLSFFVRISYCSTML